MRYYYDSTGKVVSIGYQKGSAAEVLYFFARNGQGDVIAIYRNSDSKLIGTYEYDLWGRLIGVKEASSGIDTNGILTKNPIRYRGYYYDNESGFYYLQSRYYDPSVRRFISADNLIASPGSSVQGHNLFAYCFNNPVNMCDKTGCWPQLSEIFAAIAITAAVVSVSARVVSLEAIGVSMATVGAAPVSGTSTGVAVVANNISIVAMGVAGVAGLASLGSAAVENITKKQTQRKHTIYVLKDSTGKVQYVGRTVNPDKREAAHGLHPTRKKLEFQSVATGLTYDEARAVEQALMIYHHTINAENSMNNQINGIAPKYWDTYKKFAKAYAGTIKYMENSISNEILYWSGN